MGALSDLEMGRRWLQLDPMGMRERYGALALPVTGTFRVQTYLTRTFTCHGPSERKSGLTKSGSV